MTYKQNAKLQIAETIYKTKEQENRLTILETNYINFDKKLDEIKIQLGGFCEPEKGIFSVIAKSLQEHSDGLKGLRATTKLHWYFISAIIIGILGIALKIILK